MNSFRVTFAPEYQNDKALNDFVRQLPSVFDEQGELIYDKRNRLKIFKVKGSTIGQIAVKRFKRPNVIQNVVYSFFAKNKAYRAFYNALTLLERGIKTPHPVAFMEEIVGRRFIGHTYLVTEVIDWPPIKSVLKEQHDYNEEVLTDFARFAAQLHAAGILHHDLNDTNVLFQRTQQGTEFALIDNNRMDILPLGQQPTDFQRYENLTRFTNRLERFRFVAQRYIEYRNNADDNLDEMLEVKKKHDRQRLRRKRILHPRTERYRHPLT